MAESDQDKSEQATPFKLQKARERGTVARSSDMGFLTGLLALLAFSWMEGPGLAKGLANAIRNDLLQAGSLADGAGPLSATISALFASLLRPLFLFAATVFLVVLLCDLAQTGIVFSAQPLKPDLSRLNPASGLKRLFTVRLLIETAKNVLKIGAYSLTGYLVVRHALLPEAVSIRDTNALSDLLVETAFRLLTAFCGIALAFAVLDQLIVRRAFSRKMAMSRREVRRETREREGDARLKQKRKLLHAEFSKSSQSLQNLKGADFVITNPEHIALALRYDRRTMSAPRIVSVGIDHLARKIKHLALLYGVPVIENRALARALYHKGALNSPIPNHCYQPVADIYNGLGKRAGNH